MLKALFWKEWRQNRIIFFGAIFSFIGLTLFFTILFPFLDTKEKHPELFHTIVTFLGWFIIPFFSSAITANIIGDEYDKKTINFLQILPISRKRIFWSKLGVDLFLILLVSIIIITIWFISVEINKLSQVSDFLFYIIMYFLTPIPYVLSSLLMTVITKKAGLGMFLGILLPCGFSTISISIVDTLDNLQLSADVLNLTIVMSIAYILFCYICIHSAYIIFIKRELTE